MMAEIAIDCRAGCFAKISTPMPTMVVTPESKDGGFIGIELLAPILVFLQ